MTGLLGMAWIALVDRDREQQPRVADLMRPGHRDARDAGFLDVLAQQRRAHDGAVAADFVGRALRHAAEQDRLVAIIYRLDVEHRLQRRPGGVITGPLAERT